MIASKEELNKMKKAELIKVVEAAKNDMVKANNQVILACDAIEESREVVEGINIFITKAKSIFLATAMVCFLLGYVVGMLVDRFIK